MRKKENGQNRTYGTIGRPRAGKKGKHGVVSGKKQIYLAKKKKKRTQKRILIGAIIFIIIALLFGLVMLARGIIVKLNGNNDGIGTFFDKRPIIALDAGHGGVDIGALGIENEVVITERTVKHLYDLLDEDRRFKPVLCREFGEGATPGERGRMAASKNADLVISVHGNASEENARGFECYPIPPQRDNHEESVRFAQLVVNQFSSQDAIVRGENGIRYVYYAQDENSDENGKQFKEFSDTYISDAPTFGVLQFANCPAVLVEQCFITDQTDHEAFASEAGSKRTADIYYNAICEYFAKAIA